MPSTIAAGEAERSADRHARILQLLRDPSSYAGIATVIPETVDVHETHGALVFLAGDVALKIKRPVKLSYLDFSTATQRSAALRRELEVNRPNAPDLYRDVVPITEDAKGHLALGGAGEVVEHALVMQRFPDGALLSERVAAGRTPPDLGRALGDLIARMHARSHPVHDDAAPERLGAVVRTIASRLGQLPRLADEAARFADLGAARLHDLDALLHRRVREGRVARCHGDLHLANLVWIDGRPVAFDAIEFDEDLATIDVLYDLAFTVMDLERAGLGSEANGLLNRWLWRSGRLNDLDGLAAMPLFLATRAGVRAMVAADRAAQITGAGAHDAALAESAALLDRAVGYLAPPGPALIAVGGLSGTGKSTLAAGLAPRIGPSPGAVHLRSDLERKALLGADELDRLGPEAYAQDVTRATYARVADRAGHALRAGHAVVADAVFAQAQERAEIAAVAVAAGVPFLGLWLDAPADVLKARVAARRDDASDATVAVVEAQLARRACAREWVRIDAGGDRDASLRSARAVVAANIGACVRH